LRRAIAATQHFISLPIFARYRRALGKRSELLFRQV
jgi:hypothetical protein